MGYHNRYDIIYRIDIRISNIRRTYENSKCEAQPHTEKNELCC